MFDTIRFDEFGSPEIEVFADLWEEEQEVLRQLAEAENFEVGDGVVFTDNASIALFGSGVNVVESVNADFTLTVRLWHGKRSVTMPCQEFRKLCADDFTGDVMNQVLSACGSERVTVMEMVKVLMATFPVTSEFAFQVADEFMNTLQMAGR